MSDTHTEGPAEEIVAVPGPSVGERLRAAREAKGMTSADIAAVLKLSPRQIDALELGDWSSLPGNAFARGFVRNYARAVQLDADALLVDLDIPVPPPPRLDPPQNATAVMPPAGQAQKKDYAVVLAGFALMTVAVVAYFLVPAGFWQSQPRESPPPVADSAPAPLFPPAAPAGESSPAGGAAAAEDNVPPQLPPASTAGKPGPTNAAPASVAAPDAVAAPAQQPSANALNFRFAEPSWVEVRDRSGQIIFSQLNPAGSARAVDGQPPFALVIGNAAHVTLTYKGRTVELQPRSKDDVARVTLE